MRKLTNEEIAEKFANLEGWRLNGPRIEKDFEFEDFSAAIAFMNRLVPIAERLNHHPDWSNVYNKVHIALTSHEVDGLTEKDFAFATAAEETIQTK